MAMSERQKAAAAANRAYNATCRKALSSGQWSADIGPQWDAVRLAYEALTSSEKGYWAGFNDYCACQNVTPMREMRAEFQS
jgi:hypothetical protein